MSAPSRLPALFLFFLCFSSLLSASQVWRVAATGQITTKPVIFNNGVAVATTAGEVFLLQPGTGVVTWKATVGGTPLQPVISQNKLVVATTGGKVVLLGTAGTAEKSFDLAATRNVTYIYGMDASATRIFLATDRGMVSIGAAGDVAGIYNSTRLNGQVSVAPNAVLFNEGTMLVKASETGAVAWKRDVGGTWLSKPVVDGSAVYVGSLDNSLHALDLAGGTNRWSYDTGSWVLSTPLVKDGVVYFGSNDGGVYALDQSDGTLLWKAKTPLAAETRPEPGQMGGEDVIFVGSTANGIYAIEEENGLVLWMGSVDGWVSDPIFYQNRVIFGSADKGIYSYSTERACSILTPSEGDVVGYKEIKVTGSAVSAAGSPGVLVRVNSGDWMDANMTGNEDQWVYYINPSTAMSSGVNTISCMVYDDAGQESGKFTEIAVTRDPTVKLSQFVPVTSGTGLEGDVLTVKVYDAADGSPVERFTANVDGTSYFANADTVNVTLGAGTHSIIVRKAGYEDLTIGISIGSKGTSPFLIGGAVVLLLVAAWFLFTNVLRKK